MNNTINITDEHTLWERSIVSYRMLLNWYEDEVFKQVTSDFIWIKRYELLQIKKDAWWVTIIDDISNYRITLNYDDFLDFLKLDVPVNFKEQDDIENSETWIMFDEGILEIYKNKLRVTQVIER